MDRHPSPESPFAASSGLCWGLMLALLACGGCRSVDNAQLDLMERELRKQEDYIYELEDYLLEYSEKLRACRVAHAQELKKLTTDKNSAAGVAKRSGDEIPEPELAVDPPRRPTEAGDAPAGRRRPPTVPAEPPEAVQRRPAVDADDAAPLEIPYDSLEEPGPLEEPAIDEALPSVPQQRPAGETLPVPRPLPEGPVESINPEELDVPELDIGEFGAVTPVPSYDPPAGDEAPRWNAIEEEAALEPRQGGDHRALSHRSLEDAGSMGDQETLLIPHPADFVDEGPELLLGGGPAGAVSDAELGPEFGPLDDLDEASITEEDRGAAPELAGDSASPTDSLAAVVRPARLEATQIKIRHVLMPSREHAADAEFSLLAVVEVLSALEEPVEADGEVSLMVMAVDAPGSLRTIERWDFSAAEAESAWQSTPLGDGLHLQLPIELSQLPTQPLQLWARVVTSAGTKMLTQLPLELARLSTLEDAMAQAEQRRDRAAESVAGGLAAVDSRAESSVRSARVASRSAGVESTPATSAWRAAAQPLSSGQNGGATAAQVPGASSQWTARAGSEAASRAEAPVRGAVGQESGGAESSGPAWRPYR